MSEFFHAKIQIGMCRSVVAALLLGGCGSGEEPVIVQTASMSHERTQLLTPLTGVAAEATTARAYYPALQQIYIAYFGRPADADGLEFYAKNLAESHAPTDLRALLESGGQNSTVRALLDGFGNSAESKALYGTDTAAFVTAVYRNVLGRIPERSGLNYWKRAIDEGTISQASAAFWILVGATQPGNSDGDLVRVKLAAATAFTEAIKTQEQRVAYSGNGAILKARTYLSTLTPSQNLTILPGMGQNLLDELVIARNPRKVVIRGTVAMGNPVFDAFVTAYDQNGLVKTVKSLVDGTFELESESESELVAPVLLKAEFTQFGKKVSLFSISTSADGRSLRINVTPISDMITRAYDPAPRPPDPLASLYNEPSRLERIKTNAKKLFGPLLPASAPDPIDSYMVADPQLNVWDAALDKLSFTQDESQTKITAVDGTLLAAVTDTELESSVFSNPISSVDSDYAIRAREAVTEPVTPIVNEDKLPTPASFKAIATGGLTYRLTWKRIPGNVSYYIYMQKDAPPDIKPGTYPTGQLVPTLAAVGNAYEDHEVDYRVDSPGLYYWVISAVSNEGPLTTFTLGGISNPVSLRFGEEPEPVPPKPADPDIPVGTEFSDWIFQFSDKPLQRRYAVESMNGTVATVRVQYRILKSDPTHCTLPSCNGYFLYTSFRTPVSPDDEQRYYWFTKDFEGPWEASVMKLDFKIYPDGTRLKWSKDRGIWAYHSDGTPGSGNGSYSCVADRMGSSIDTGGRCAFIDFSQSLIISPTTPDQH